MKRSPIFVSLQITFIARKYRKNDQASLTIYGVLAAKLFALEGQETSQELNLFITRSLGSLTAWRDSAFNECSQSVSYGAFY